MIIYEENQTTIFFNHFILNWMFQQKIEVNLNNIIYILYTNKIQMANSWITFNHNYKLYIHNNGNSSLSMEHWNVSIIAYQILTLSWKVNLTTNPPFLRLIKPSHCRVCNLSPQWQVKQQCCTLWYWGTSRIYFRNRFHFRKYIKVMNCNASR